MDISEFRIGNLYYWAKEKEENILSIKLSDFEQLFTGEDNIESYFPIPINKERLEKFNLFVKGINYYIDSCFSLDEEGHVYYSGDYIGVNVRTVHALQNLYFALTGKELILK